MIHGKMTLRMLRLLKRDDDNDAADDDDDDDDDDEQDDTHLCAGGRWLSWLQ